MPNNPVFTPVDASGNVLGASGSPTYTVPQPPVALYSEATTSRTTNGAISNQTWTNNVSQAIVGVNVTVFTGGTNVVVSLQQQDANGQWQTIGSTQAITAVGSANFSVGPGMTNGAVIVAGGTYRLAWTLTGTFTALSFQLSVQGR